MTLTQYFKHSILFVSLVVSLVLPREMGTLHDKDDAEYLKLGAQFPAVGKVGKRAGDGTLIRSNWVLTAAHVASGVQRRDGDNFKVYFEGYPEGIAVEAIFIHPGFRPMQGHDMALIKLKENASKIQPLGLYKRADENGKAIVIVGHGDVKKGNETSWKVDGKRRAATNTITAVTLNDIQYHFDKPGSKNVTELEGTAGRGDSGGPAVIEKNGAWLIAGISSAGQPGENGPGTYGAIEHYTRVSTHSKWLEDVLDGKISYSKIGASSPNRGQQVVVTRGSHGPRPPVIEGLGLILGQGNNKIVVDGKIDQEVPDAFKQLIFGGNAHVVALNGGNIQNLSKFKKEFAAIKMGDSYSITFSINGELKKFELTKD